MTVALSPSPIPSQILAQLTRIEGFKQLLRSLRIKPEHERRILRAWIRGDSLDSCRHQANHYYPTEFLKQLPSISQGLQALCQTHSEYPSQDGSSRLLLKLHDGQMIETVLLPRDGVCVSTQVGCAVGCVFCMTGRSGLIRQLGSSEIAAQVILARKKQFIRKVVFMGMGEPSHNLNNVLEAIELLGTEGALAHKQMVFSTVGDRRVFERLPQSTVKPALALSLHTTRQDLREKLLPRAPRISPEELIQLAEGYAQATTYPIQYQWTLLEGINDSDEELEGIIKLLKRKRAILNLIPYNETAADSDLRRPQMERAIWMARTLHQKGILTKIRRSAGQDVDGGCGQLRARATIEQASPTLQR